MAKDFATAEAGSFDRPAWMGLLARAPEGRVAELLSACGPAPDFVWLRQPEIGSVMVEARTGGSGTPFNLGEMTVTRAALRLGCGTEGHAYVQGRSRPHAEAAALVDALMQGPKAALVAEAVLHPLATEEAARQLGRARKAAATRVEFFTMVRGED